MPLRQIQLRLFYRTGRGDLVKGVFVLSGKSPRASRAMEFAKIRRPIGFATPLSPAFPYNPIIVTPHEAPEMVVVGEWVSSID